MKIIIQSDRVHFSLPVPKILVLQPFLLRRFAPSSGLDRRQLSAFCRNLRNLCKTRPGMKLLEVETGDVHIQITA